MMNMGTKPNNHTNTERTVTNRGKNLRLSFEAWQAIRHLKFEEGVPTYTDVLLKVFDAFEGKAVRPQDTITAKLPEDAGDARSPRSDKTIVVSPQVHKKLNEIKTRYMLEKGIASRGPNSISISDILLDLIDHYKKLKKGGRK